MSLRGLNNCRAKDLVWGTVPHVAPDYGQSPVKCYDGLAKVHTKVTPFGGAAQGMARGEVPNQWYDGELIALPRTVDSAGGIFSGPHSPLGPALIAGTHCGYVAGQQRFVNTFHFRGILENGTFGMVHWAQYDIEQNAITNSGPFRNHSSETTPFDSSNDSWPLTLDNFIDGPFPDFTGNNHVTGTYQDKLNVCLKPGSYARKKVRPNSWSWGKRYLVFSSYLNTDGLEGTFCNNCRYDTLNVSPDNTEDHWFSASSSLTTGLDAFKLVRPSLRQYMETEDGDEPWMCLYNDATGAWGTLKWTANATTFTASDLENVYHVPSGLGSRANCLCYLRCQGRDLFVFRKAKEGVGGEATRSTDYWIFDGSVFIHLTGEYGADRPSTLMLDEAGNLYWGNSRRIRRYTAPGWLFTDNAQFKSAGEAISIEESEPASDPEAPENNVGTEDYEIAAASQSEENHFQMLPAGGYIHVKGYRATVDRATLPVENVDWPEWQMARSSESGGGPVNSREGQARAAEVIFGWSISRDGSVWVPHVQAHFPYQGGSDTTTRRIHGRAYIARDTSEYDPAGQYGDPTIFWVKYRSSNTPQDMPDGMDWFRPWLDRFGGFYPSGEPKVITYDKFISEVYNFDFDPAVDCPCCCTDTNPR